jgi:hypothetical protein
MRKQSAVPNDFERMAASFLRSGWFLVVSGAILGILALTSLSWWSNRFLLNAVTRIVEISASAPGNHEIGAKLPENDEIRIFGARADDLPPELRVLRASMSSLRLIASNAVLQRISLEEGSGLSVDVTPNVRVDIGLLNKGSISLALSGKIQRVDDSGERVLIADIERATEWNIKPIDRSTPARLVVPLGAATRISIFNQPISEFFFRFPESPDDDPRTLQSEIEKGELRILETGTTIQLKPRELILLEGGSRFLSRLAVTDAGVSVDISGEATRISVGPPRPGIPLRLDRDLTPSVLSYLLSQHELKLLWGVTLAIMGALWKARQWALKY